MSAKSTPKPLSMQVSRQIAALLARAIANYGMDLDGNEYVAARELARAVASPTGAPGPLRVALDELDLQRAGAR